MQASRSVLPFMLMLLALNTLPAGADDLSALDLKPSRRSNSGTSQLHGYVEGGGARYFSARDEYDDFGSVRASVDLRWKHAFESGAQLHLANHLDVNCQKIGDERCVQANTLKEAYLSTRPMTSMTLDAGRVNARYGVAYGYNPTDLFRQHAIRSVSSFDPESLRENRLGSAMLRTQYRWDESSLTAIISPRLGSHRSPKSWSLDWGASNMSHRWMLAYSPGIMGNTSSQVIVANDSESGPMLGLNLSSVISDNTSVHFEWLTERGLDQQSRALGLPGSRNWRSRMSTGATYTTAQNVSITLEVHHNGLAPDKADWQALRTGPESAYASYRDHVDEMQDLQTRWSLFTYLRWDLPGRSKLSTTGMLRHDPVDHSSMAWLELRQRLEDIDLALQLGYSRGEEGSALGNATHDRQVVLLARKSF